VTSVLAGVFTALFLVGSFATIVAMWISRQSIIYLLMRKAVDGTDMTEVFQEEKEEEDYLAKAAGEKAEAGEEGGKAEEEAKPEEGKEPSAETSAEEGEAEKGSEGESPRRPRRRPTRGKEGESE
jgi:ribosomal protein L12E/L44/L45/RPP1/RPP2